MSSKDIQDVPLIFSCLADHVLSWQPRKFQKHNKSNSIILVLTSPYPGLLSVTIFEVGNIYHGIQTPRKCTVFFGW